MRSISAVPRSNILRAVLWLAGSLALCQPVLADEYGLGDYLLGYSLPMAGYTPPPGILFLGYVLSVRRQRECQHHFSDRQNAAAGVTYNFLFDIDQIAWVTDVKVLGGSLGFVALLPFGGERTSASLAFTGPLGNFREIGQNASVDALGDSAYAAFLGWDSGEHHWNATLTGFAPTGYYSSTALAFTSLHRPASI